MKFRTAHLLLAFGLLIAIPARAGELSAYAAPTARAALFIPTVNQAKLNATVTSAEVSVSGLGAPKPLSIANGKYSLNGGPYTDKSGTLSDGDKLKVQVQSAAQANTATRATLTIGGQTVYFVVTTVFVIPPVAAAPLNAAVISSTVTIRGLLKPARIQIDGGRYSINGKTFTDLPGFIVNGAKLRIRVQSSHLPRTLTSATVTIGTVSTPFDVTTHKFTKVAKLSEVLSDLDGATLNDDGTVSIASAKAVKLLAKPLADAIIKLTKGTPLSNNAGTLTFTAQSDDASLKTKDVGTASAFQVVSGSYAVQSSGTNLIPVGNGSLRTSACSTALQMYNSGLKTQTFVQNCTVYFQADTAATTAGFAAETGTPVYAGETADVDEEGSLSAIRIGSLNGDQNLPGDPLTPSGVTVEESVPRLAGTLARLGGTASLLDVVKAGLDGQFGTSGTISYSETSGVATYRVGGKTYHFLPLGSPAVRLGGTLAGNRFAAASAATSASGAFSLASQGIEITLAGTFGYFADLDTSLKAIDPAATLQIRSSGAIQMRLSGADYVCAPSSNASGGGASGQTPTFTVDGSGLFGFVDSSGATQTLYPVFADITVADQTVKAVDGAGEVSDSGAGNSTMTLGGASYTLKPEYLLETAPDSHSGELWWADGAKIYLRYNDGTAQSFTMPQ
ncbi:MAG: hypothetical protein KGZ83_12300 [Sulfuricella sp.]|nr:hypothetical protein [Sulfuricella sp.]